MVGITDSQKEILVILGLGVIVMFFFATFAVFIIAVVAGMMGINLFTGSLFIYSNVGLFIIVYLIILFLFFIYVYLELIR